MTPPSTQAGTRVVRVPDQASSAGVVRRITVIAEAVGAAASGAALVEEVQNGFAELDRERSAAASPLRVLFILSLQNGRPVVGGRGTSADAMLTLAGATIAAAALEGWKPLSDEGVIAAAPQALVMMDRGPNGPPADPFGLPAFAATPAASGRRLVVMDGNYLPGFGPRAPQAAMDLRRALQAYAGKAPRP